MKRGQKRPRQWNNQATPGRPSIQTIRKALQGVALGLAAKTASPKQRMRFLNEFQRLEALLQKLTVDRLKQQLEDLEAPAGS